MRLRKSLLKTMTATAIKLTLLGCVAGTVQRMDADGICDDVDDCVGQFDACGVCNGPGAALDQRAHVASRLAIAIAMGMSLMLVGWCGDRARHLNVAAPTFLPATAIAMATSLAALGVAVPAPKTSTKTASATTWTPRRYVDACGICNGPGDIYECGCANIPPVTAMQRQPTRRLGRVRR